MKLLCAHCGTEIEKSTGEINRALKRGYGLYCDKKCSGKDRRDKRTVAEKKLAKRLYDMEYRKNNKEMLKAKKSAYFKKSYDPEKARIERKKNMHRHVEYCRQPEYKAYKREYDQEYRAKKGYGEFAGAFIALLALEQQVGSMASKYEVAIANGTLGKKQKRRREYERLNSNKSERCTLDNP